MPRRIDPSLIPHRPDLSFEQAFWQQGISAVAGIDEAGRGCLAGPVTAAAVILPPESPISEDLDGIQDSKQLSPAQREKFRPLIENRSLSWGIGWATNQEIDSCGILPATHLAAWRAIQHLAIAPHHLLIDYLELPDIDLPQTRLVKGDQRSLTVAAASILAKTHRDSWMCEHNHQYPQYGFQNNKGYGTASHRQAIEKFGPSPLHRLSFSPLRDRSSS